MMLVIINSILKLYINTIDEYAEGNDITYKLIKANADIKRHFEKKDTDSTKDKLKALYHLKYYNSGSESIDKLYKYFKEDTKINNKTFTNEEKNAIINKLGKEHKTQNEAIFDSNIKLNNLMAYDDIKKGDIWLNKGQTRVKKARVATVFLLIHRQQIHPFRPPVLPFWPTFSFSFSFSS